jgi:hypothetical protein
MLDDDLFKIRALAMANRRLDARRAAGNYASRAVEYKATASPSLQHSGGGEQCVQGGASPHNSQYSEPCRLQSSNSPSAIGVRKRLLGFRPLSGISASAIGGTGR